MQKPTEKSLKETAINPSTSENLPLCIMQSLDNYNYFGYLKGANEVNWQYFQQAVLYCAC